MQAREKLSSNLNENVCRRILTISGRADEWIQTIEKVVLKEGEGSDVAIVERSFMGRELLKRVPRDEWVYLINPSMADDDCLAVKEKIVGLGELFSPAFAEWLDAQEIGSIYKLSSKKFTPEEARVMRLLWNNQESVCEREEVAVALWGNDWTEKYSDWGIDALMSRLRKKMLTSWQIVTIKGRGYMLASTLKPTTAPQIALKQGELVSEIAGSIYPSKEYLEYMNDSKRVRKVYKDLFAAIEEESAFKIKHKPTRILCVNSYSYDNVDSVVSWVKQNNWGEVKIYFTHYDPRAVEMHTERIKELGVSSYVESQYDDIRESKLKESTFDIVINDFRLNFNQNDVQNKSTLKHVWRILKNQGIAIFSTVVDGRYEHLRYGQDQELAPVNANKPGMFQADEHLVRRCWSVPYYRQLFEKSGFASIREFDIEEGKRWGSQPTMTTNPWQGPYFRRWWLGK